MSTGAMFKPNLDESLPEFRDDVLSYTQRYLLDREPLEVDDILVDVKTFRTHHEERYFPEKKKRGKKDKKVLNDTKKEIA